MTAEISHRPINTTSDYLTSVSWSDYPPQQPLTQGVCQIAYGDKAEAAQRRSAASLQANYPVTLAGRGNKNARYASPPFHPQAGYWTEAQRARWAKVTLLDWSPYPYTLYLDADTRVQDPAALDTGFAALQAGYDLAITLGEHQGDDLWWHVGERERRESLDALPYTPVGWQCGLFFVARNERTQPFFNCWEYEWLRYQGEDQAAFFRALWRVPLSIWALGQPFNGGAVVSHQYGSLR